MVGSVDDDPDHCFKNELLVVVEPVGPLKLVTFVELGVSFVELEIGFVKVVFDRVEPGERVDTGKVDGKDGMVEVGGTATARTVLEG